MKTSKSILVALILGFFLLGGTLVEAADADNEFRVGVLTYMKMECGTSSLKAVQMAAEDLNAKSGVLGKQVKVIFADTEGNPEKGITGMKRLIERDKVHILVGGAVSGVTLALMDHLQKYNRIYFSTGVSSPLIAKKVEDNYEKYKYQFRTTINALALCKSIVEDELGIFVSLGYKKFAILAEDAAWNRGLVNYLQKNIGAIGGTIVDVVQFDPSTIDFAPIFSKIASSKADVAIPLLAHTDTITLYKQWSQMKSPFRMAGFSNPGMDAEYWAKTGGACLGEVNCMWGAVIRTTITPNTIPFFDKYRAKFKEAPHSCASTSYDALAIIADAAQRAKSLETETLIKALEQTDYVGITGRYVFDKKNHDARYGSEEFCPFLITQWQEGGAFNVIAPLKFAKGKYQDPPWLKK